MKRILFLLIVLAAAVCVADEDGASVEIRGAGAIQGEPVLLTLTTDKPAAWATATFLGQNLRFDPEDDVLIALVAVDRNKKPGDYTLDVNVQYADGTKGSFSKAISVAGKTFPTSQLSVDPRFVTLSKEDLEWVKKDNEAAAKAYASSSELRLWHGAWQQPAEGRWSSAFGVRRLFNGEERSYHSGADIAIPTGTPVSCSNSGRVALVRHMFFGGKTVLVDHGQGVFTGYMHLSEFKVAEGDIVEPGQLIGISGSTGRVTGPHLHWMLRINNIKVNARSLLSMYP